MAKERFMEEELQKPRNRFCWDCAKAEKTGEVDNYWCSILRVEVLKPEVGECSWFMPIKKVKPNLLKSVVNV